MEISAVGAQGLARQQALPAEAAGRAEASKQRAAAPAEGLSLQKGAAGNSADAASGKAKEGRFDRNECQTCKNRRYQDGSDDPGVSFKTPGKISPSAAPSMVRKHEYEHVFRERSKALREGREVVSQSVILKTGICPECGRAYVSGGTTRTVTRASQELDEILAAQRESEGQVQAEA